MSSSVEVAVWVGTTNSVIVDLAVAVLTLAAAFIFGFPAAGLVANVDLGLDFLGDGHLKLRWRLHDRLRRGFKIWGWSGGGLANTPPSNDVINADFL